MIVWENAQVRGSLVRGMEQAAQGKVVDLGGFAQYADDEEENA